MKRLGGRAYVIVLLAAYAAYSAAWSYITLAKVYDLRATVGDLGIIIQGAWDSVSSGPSSLVNSLLGQAALLIYAAFIPLGSHMIEALVVFQTLWLGAAVFPIYGIARRYLRSEAASAMLAVSYLIYFPLAGVNWFDVHRQALFPTMFMTAYYLYLKGGRSRYASVPLMVFSSMLRFGYEVYTLWLGVVLMGLWAVRDRRDHFSLWAGLSLVVASLLLVGYNIGALRALTSPPAQAAASLSSAVTSTSSTYLRLGSLPSQLERIYIVMPPVYEVGRVQLLYIRGYVIDALTLGLALLPVLGLPLLSWRWGPALIPMIVLMVFSTYWGYHYPLFFRFEYPSIIMAPVWLGTVEGAAYLSGRLSRRGVRRAAVYLAAGVLVASATTAAFFEPYGPFNYMAFDYYQLGQWTRYNTTYFNDMVNVISMVPRNTTAIALQDNMPELLPRPGGDALLGCLQLSDVRYVLVNVVHSLYLYYDNTDVCGNWSMLDVADWALSHGFGVVAEEGGTMLLEENYTGGVVRFSPYSYRYEASGLWPLLSTWLAGGYINVTDFYSPRPVGLFEEPHAMNFLPGTYEVTFTVMNDGLAPGSRIYAVVVGYAPGPGGALEQVTLLNQSVNLSSLPEGRWVELSYTFTSSRVVGYGSAFIAAGNVSGTLLVKGLTVKELSPTAEPSGSW